MTLEFLRLPLAERQLYIEQAASRRDVSPVFMEKDFWLCGMLAVLFESMFANVLMFKECVARGSPCRPHFGPILCVKGCGKRCRCVIQFMLMPYMHAEEAGFSRE